MVEEVVEEFKGADGSLWVYNFRNLWSEQVEGGMNVFLLYQYQQQNPPRTVDEMKGLGHHKTMQQALAYIVNRMMPDGKLEEWDESTMPNAVALIRNQRGSDWKRLMRCRDNFFDNTDITDAASIVPYMNLIREMGGTASLLTADARKSALAALVHSSSLIQDSTQEKPDEEPTSGVTPASSGSSQEGT